MAALTISNVLGSDTLEAVLDLGRDLTWRDGKVTAGGQAKQVKQNEQANLNATTGPAIRKLISEKLAAHPVVSAAARPQRFGPPMISRTRHGGYYGPHVDNALMRVGEDVYRADLSFTLFLTPPEDYGGGELCLHDMSGRHSFKPSQGDLVLYPTADIHEVKPVTHGERLVCAGWIQSLIADTAQRTLLFDLENLRASLRTQISLQSEELLALDKAIGNLLRMWAKP